MADNDAVNIYHTLVKRNTMFQRMLDLVTSRSMYIALSVIESCIHTLHGISTSI